MEDLDDAEAAPRHPVLVVDDEEEILFSLRGLLRQEFEVHTARTGAEALDLMRRHMFHVILSDQRMPETSGVELLRQAREVSPWSIRLLFTGYADIKSVVDAINRGQVYRYLTKPWDPDELAAVLRQACDEYDRLTARRTLFLDLRDYAARCGRVTGDEGLRASGAELVARIERVLAEDEGRGGLSLG